MLCLRNLMTVALVGAGAITLGGCAADSTPDDTTSVATPLDNKKMGGDKTKGHDDDDDKGEHGTKPRKPSCDPHDKKCDEVLKPLPPPGCDDEEDKSKCPPPRPPPCDEKDKGMGGCPPPPCDDKTKGGCWPPPPPPPPPHDDDCDDGQTW